MNKKYDKGFELCAEVLRLIEDKFKNNRHGIVDIIDNQEVLWEVHNILKKKVPKKYRIMAQLNKENESVTTNK